MNIHQKIDNLKRLNYIKHLITINKKPSLNNIDDKLQKYLDFENGFFVEIGANDGYNQSNTFYLEYEKNWKGLLIEAIPDLYRKCKYCRMNSIVLNYACVPNNFAKKTARMHYANLMSLIDGAMHDKEKETEHIFKGLKCQNISTGYTIDVKTITLGEIFKQLQIYKINFLSVDVEGYEAQVLSGIDYQVCSPEFILVEARFLDDVMRVLSSRYNMIEQITHHDYLFMLR